MKDKSTFYHAFADFIEDEIESEDWHNFEFNFRLKKLNAEELEISISDPLLTKLELKNNKIN